MAVMGIQIELTVRIFHVKRVPCCLEEYRSMSSFIRPIIPDTW